MQVAAHITLESPDSSTINATIARMYALLQGNALVGDTGDPATAGSGMGSCPVPANPTGIGWLDSTSLVEVASILPSEGSGGVGAPSPTESAWATQISAQASSQLGGQVGDWSGVYGKEGRRMEMHELLLKGDACGMPCEI